MTSKMMWLVIGVLSPIQWLASLTGNIGEEVSSMNRLECSFNCGSKKNFEGLYSDFINVTV